MIVISQSLALSLAGTDNPAYPVILWNTVLEASTVEADQEAEGYPASNLTNPSTYERWMGEDDEEQHIIFTVNGAPVDAIGLARHNFGSGNIVVSIEAHDGDENWQEILEEFMPADDRPLLLRFEVQHTAQIRIRLQPSETVPRAAVAMAGLLMVMPRGIIARHVPLNLARQTQVVNGRSESGNFLGRIITGQSKDTSVQFQGIERDWYYDHFEPFVANGARNPFFFAWLPKSRPQDVGYAWLKSDPQPSFGTPMQGVDVTLDIGGIA